MLNWVSSLVGSLDAHGAALTALATIAMAFFTGTLWFVTNRATNLAREEFISTHRPRIILREVALVGGQIHYMLVNTGTEAVVAESWILVETMVADQHIRNLRSLAHDDLGRMSFAPGEIKDLIANAGEGGFFIRFPEAARIVGEDGRRIGDIYFAGAILYRDRLGNLRRSVFRRRWDRVVQAFVRTDNPDQEYAD